MHRASASKSSFPFIFILGICAIYWLKAYEIGNECVFFFFVLRRTRIQFCGFRRAYQPRDHTKVFIECYELAIFSPSLHVIACYQRMWKKTKQQNKSRYCFVVSSYPSSLAQDIHLEKLSLLYIESNSGFFPFSFTYLYWWTSCVTVCVKYCENKLHLAVISSLIACICLYAKQWKHEKMHIPTRLYPVHCTVQYSTMCCALL